MYAVIDTETTGLNPGRDRIIELAVIGLDADGNREWEWCSLLNPERDTGSGLVIKVHQIYPSDVANAPTFADFAGHIVEILQGRALIAHNAKFDLGMLGAEFRRLGIALPPIPRICTADLARGCGFRPWRLEACCSALGIEPEGAHHALADARATWNVARQLLDFSHEGVRENVKEQLCSRETWPVLPVSGRDPLTRPIMPVRKPQRPPANDPGVRTEAVNTAPVIASFTIDRSTPETKYLAAVEWVLEDRTISPEEKETLDALREELVLTDEQVHSAHMTFVRGLAGSMWDDGEISAHEKFDLELVAKALHLGEGDIQYALDNPIGLDLINEDYRLHTGAKVVFTGEMSIPRSEWKARAEAVGLRVVSSVSGETDYLVVPYGETGSSKSRKARRLGVRVVSEQRFLRMVKQLS